MRLLILYDLPVKKVDERKRAAKFRDFLLDDGYRMIQFSVYMRICKGFDAVDKHVKRLKVNVPPRGEVRALVVTEMQFNRMAIILGKRKNPEKCSQSQLILL